MKHGECRFFGISVVIISLLLTLNIVENYFFFRRCVADQSIVLSQTCGAILAPGFVGH